MSRCLVLVHTVPPLLEVFRRLTAELLPGVQVLQILDEPMLERVKRRGRLAAEDGARLAEHVAVAAAVGAGAVLITCSTVSPVVDMVRPTASIPVLKIDEAMIAEAVRLGRRVGVVATAASTLEPTRGLLEAEAARQGKTITTELVLVDGAIDGALRRGRREPRPSRVVRCPGPCRPFRCRGVGSGLHGARVGGHAGGPASRADPLQSTPGAGPGKEPAGRSTFIALKAWPIK